MVPLFRYIRLATIAVLGLPALSSCAANSSPANEVPGELPDLWESVPPEDLHFEPESWSLAERFAEPARDRTVIATCVERGSGDVHDVDANGNLWLGGGEEALARVSPDGVVEEVALGLAVDTLRPLPGGRLVVASGGELQLVDERGRMESIRFDVDGDVRPVAFCGDPTSDLGGGYVFAESEGGLRLYRRKQGRWNRIRGGFESGTGALDWLARAQGACHLADERIWFASDGELWTLDAGDLRGGPLPELVGTTSLAADPAFGVVIARRGLALQAAGEWDELPIGPRVRWVAAGDGELWVFTDDGVFRARAEGLERLLIPNLPTTDAPRILPFAGGFWWVAEDEACVVRANEVSILIEGVLPYADLSGGEVLRVPHDASVRVDLDGVAQFLAPVDGWFELALEGLDFGWHRLDISMDGAEPRRLYVHSDARDGLWETDIQPIAQRSCGLSAECHRSAEGRPDLVTLDDWRTHIFGVQQRVLVEQDMPPAESAYQLSASELRSIARWIEGGCPARGDAGGCEVPGE